MISLIVFSSRPFVISTAGRNLTSSMQGDFSHPFEITRWPGPAVISTVGRNLLAMRNEICWFRKNQNKRSNAARVNYLFNLPVFFSVGKAYGDILTSVRNDAVAGNYCHFDPREKSPRIAEWDFSPPFEMTQWLGACCHFDRREKSPGTAEWDFSHPFEMTRWPGTCYHFDPREKSPRIAEWDFSPPFEMTRWPGLAVISTPGRNLLALWQKIS